MREIELATVDGNGNGNENAGNVTLRVGEPADAVVVLVDGGDEVEVRGLDYWECLTEVRELLEERGRLLCCQGARGDVWLSGQLRQFSNGSRAYVLDPAARGSGDRWEVVDVFAPASGDVVVGMAEQRERARAFFGLT